MLMLLLPGSAILEPDLRDPFAETGDLSDPFQVLAVRVRVQLEVSLKNLQLFFRESRTNAFRFTFVVTFWVTAI